MDTLDGWTMLVICGGVLFVAVGALQLPYARYPCGHHAAQGASCLPTGAGVSSLILIALGAALLITGGYMRSRRARLRPLFLEKRKLPPSASSKA